jgi:hypothetical protein
MAATDDALTPTVVWLSGSHSRRMFSYRNFIAIIVVVSKVFGIRGC